MSRKVLFVGLDALDPGLVEAWSAHLPTLGRLASRGAVGDLTNPAPLLPGAIWPMINGSEHPTSQGLFYHPAQIRTGESQARSIGDEDLVGHPSFWSTAAAAGRRVIVLDPIQSPLAAGQPPFAQVVEWGSHDALGSPRAQPTGLLDDVLSAVGRYPVERCDWHDRSEEGYRSLLERLIQGADMKAEAFRLLATAAEWDLATVVFTEGHCAGHQFWHFHDPDHPWFSPAAPADLADSLLAVYRAVDRSLGAVLDMVGDDATVVVVASHGIERFRRAYGLLPAMLDRLGYGPGKRLRLRVGRMIPRPVRLAIRRRTGQAMLNRLQLGASSRILSFDGSRTTALAVPNGVVGAIRLNMVGREPDGAVQPGPEADRILNDIASAVGELREPESRQPAVERIEKTAGLYGPDHHPDLPDLLIGFRTDLGTLEQLESPRLGRLGPPAPTVRSGDHRLEARWWVAGPSIAPSSLAPASVLDIAPTVLDLLGIEPPESMHGSPVSVADRP